MDASFVDCVNMDYNSANGSVAAVTGCRLMILVGCPPWTWRRWISSPPECGRLWKKLETAHTRGGLHHQQNDSLVILRTGASISRCRLEKLQEDEVETCVRCLFQIQEIQVCPVQGWRRGLKCVKLFRCMRKAQIEKERS